MNELDVDYGSESSEGSCNVLWESIKVDLDLTRAKQTEQLQSLKGTAVKLPPGKRKVLKRNRVNKYNLKNNSIQKAFKKALEMIKAVTRNPKGSKRAPSSKEHHKTTTMKFKVSDDIPETVAEREIVAHAFNNKEQETPHKGSRSEQSCIQEQSAQTEEKKLEDKFSQTSLQENSVLNPHFLMLQPVTCGMFIPALTTCCPSSVLNMCHCSSSCHVQRNQTVTWSVADKEVPSSSGKSIVRHCSLQEICEELLVRLAARNKKGLQTESLLENKHVCESKTCSVENSTNNPDVDFSDLKRLVDSLKSVYGDLKSQTSCIPPSGLKTTGTSASSQACVPAQSEVEPSNECAPHVTSSLSTTPVSTVTSEIAPHRTSSLPTTPVSTVTSEIAPSGVTQDLMQLATKIDQDVGCSDAFTISKGDPMNIFHINTSSPASRFKEDAIVPVSETLCQPMDHVSEACNDLGKNREEMNHAGPATIIKATHKYNNLPSNGTKTVDNDDDNGADIENDHCDEPEACIPKDGSGKKLISESQSAFIDNATKKTSTTGNNAENTVTEAGNDQTNGRSCEGTDREKAKLSDKDTLCTKGGMTVELVPATDGGSKVLARINGVDGIDQTGKESTNSPAFEEMDPTEMETVLLIWRQQEQLHQVNGGHQEPETSAPSSSGFLFKKPKRPRELPPELRNIRVPQPPPIRKIDNSSALQILDEVAHKPAIEDDCEDIPETSLPVISPPKKRRLRLKKNPPSPLPVVIQKSKQSKKNLKTDCIDGFTQNDSEETAPALSSESGDIPQTEQAGCARTSLRLRLAAAASKKKQNSATDEQRSIQCEDNKTKLVTATEKKQSKKKSKKEEETDNISASTVISTKKNENGTKMAEMVVDSQDEKLMNVSKHDKEAAHKMNAVHDGKVLNVIKGGINETDFNDQIKERVNNMSKKWHQDRSKDETDFDIDLTSSPPTAAPTILHDCFQGLLFQNNLQKLSDIPVYEIGKAHDLAIHIILNPWRGLNARRVTKDFVCPNYDFKTVVRSLWDLRSGANSDDVVKRIISIGWNEVHPVALKALVSLFVLSLDRNVPFVIEAATGGEEDETSSIISDVDPCSKKKTTSVRIVATKQIFKGECIEGLNGLFLKVSKKDKSKNNLKFWNFPKFVKNRNRAIFGPLAYLKKREGNCNTEAIVLKNDLVSVRALRPILCGEMLLVSFSQLESILSN